MARLHYNFIGGRVEDNPLAAAAVTFNSAGLAALPAVVSPDFVPIVFDPDGYEGAPVIKYITAHTIGATSATITDVAQEGTTAREISRDTPWVHAVTADQLVYVSRVQVRRTTNQAITTTNETPIVFDTEDIDTGGFADLVANNDGVTLASGFWFVRGTVPIDLATGSGNTMNFLLKAGGANLASVRKKVDASVVEVVELWGSTSLGAATEIQLVVQSTGTNNVVSGGYLRNATLEAWRIGR